MRLGPTGQFSRTSTAESLVRSTQPRCVRPARRHRRRLAGAWRCTSCTGPRAARRRLRCSFGGGCKGWSTRRGGRSGWAGRRRRGPGRDPRSCGSTPCPWGREWPRSPSSATAPASIPASPCSSPPPLSPHCKLPLTVASSISENWYYAVVP